MRHRKQGRALSRNPSHRRAMLANMATSVLEQERVQTTTAKAKEVRGLVDKVITYGKKGSLNHRRMALAIVSDKDVVGKVFGELSERYSDRPGGYTRVLKTGHRQGDGAPMAILELV